jgi:hypothetical protein
MKNVEQKLKAILGFRAGFAVFMLFVADMWSGTAGNLPIIGLLGALPAAMLLLVENIRKALVHIPQPVPVRRHTSFRYRSSGRRKVR